MSGDKKMTINLMEHKGQQIQIFHNFDDHNCLCCPHLKNTGFSFICKKTNEKLEGFDTKEDQKNKNMATFLPKHMGIGVGFKCPLPKVVGKFTHIHDLLEDKEMCVEDHTEECTECGECGKEIEGRCCMNPMDECTGCMEC